MTAACWVLGLFVATVVFWKFRIFDAASRRDFALGSFDIYIEHYPMTRYGFEMIGSGHIPLWNPYQLTGVPFLAIPHVGLLYPGNWIYMFLDTAIAIEVSFVMHLFLAGLGCFLLARLIGLSRLSGGTSALTFMWSGWMIFYSNQASLISGMSWLPMTIYLIERTTRGHRLAGIGVALAVACQLLNGATEFFVQNMYLGGAWSAFRLGQLWLVGERRGALWCGAGLLAAVSAGVLLASPQLLPSLELASLSVRSESPLLLGQATKMGTVSPFNFFDQALRATGIVTVGVLPLAGLFMGFGSQQRALWVLLISVIVLSVLLTFGGPVYALYFETPLGGLFRRPHKFLHLYAFAQAGLAGLAVAWLESHLGASRVLLWKSGAWLTTVGALIVGGVWLASRSELSPGLIALIAGLTLFGALPVGALRRAAMVGCVVVQAVVLFFGVEQEFVRPAARPEIFDTHRTTLTRLAAIVGEDRVHIAPDIFFTPSLRQKAGVLNRLRVLGDYEPLASQRAADYFKRAVPPRHPGDPFVGKLDVSAASRLKLLDLAAARYYVVRAGTEPDRVLAHEAARQQQTGVRMITDGFPRIYERRSAFSRARFVAEARYFEEPADLLDALAAGDFDAGREVLLEGVQQSKGSEEGLSIGHPEVSIVVDEPERVVVSVVAPVAGWLLLADAWHPGWRATVNGEHARIWPAYHLFRAVSVEAGSHVIEFRYGSRPFRIGLTLAGLTMLVLLGLAVAWRRAPESAPRKIA